MKKVIGFIKYIFIILVVLLIFKIVGESEINNTHQQDKVEDLINSFNNENIYEVKIRYNQNDDNLIFQTKNSQEIKELIDSMKDYSYGVASHPSSLNSTSYNMSFSSNDGDFFEFYIIIMKDNTKANYFLLNENSRHYESDNFYMYLVNHGIHEIKE